MFWWCLWQHWFVSRVPDQHVYDRCKRLLPVLKNGSRHSTNCSHLQWWKTRFPDKSLASNIFYRLIDLLKKTNIQDEGPNQLIQCACIDAFLRQKPKTARYSAHGSMQNLKFTEMHATVSLTLPRIFIRFSWEYPKVRAIARIFQYLNGPKYWRDKCNACLQARNSQNPNAW